MDDYSTEQRKKKREIHDRSRRLVTDPRSGFVREQLSSHFPPLRRIFLSVGDYYRTRVQGSPTNRIYRRALRGKSGGEKFINRLSRPHLTVFPEEEGKNNRPTDRKILSLSSRTFALASPRRHFVNDLCGWPFDEIDRAKS